MKGRIGYVLACILLTLFTPYWLYLPAIFLGIIVFPLFWESILLSAFIDYYYGPHFSSGILLAFPFSILSVLLVILLSELRERFRLNS